MANTNDSFIDEVTEAVRRDRLNLWFRRWGWLALAVVAVIVAFVGWSQWRQSQLRADAQLRGDAILASVEAPEAERLAALQSLPQGGPDGVVAALLAAAEQAKAGDGAGAAATLQKVASDGSVPPLWRDLAAFKAQLALGDKADPAALQALAAPGAPFRLLALEQLAVLDLGQGKRDEAVAQLQAIDGDAEVGAEQKDRVEGLLTALGAPPAPMAAAQTAPAMAPAE